MVIAIVFGGKSVEHDVSIVTAKQIYNLSKDLYCVKLFYVDKSGGINLYTNSQFNLDDFKGKNKFLFPAMFADGYAYKKNLFGAYAKIDRIDCAIMCTHGGDGENGTLCDYLTTCKIPVSAGGGLALGISMNKWITKQLLKAGKINCVPGIYVTRNSKPAELDAQINKTFGYPVIVKANGGGSSIGIKSANNFEELVDALAVAFEFDTSAVIEQKIQNFTEYNCAVMGYADNIRVSNIDEPVKHDNILSFKDKYLSGEKGSKKGSMKMQQRSYPKLELWLDKRIKTTSAKIFKDWGLHGVVRIDYILDKSNNKLYVNEVNAIPGSLGYYYFCHNRVTCNMFIESLIEIAINSYKNRASVNKDFITQLF